ncbi:hypothetical protein [Micromonospora sp. DT31]|uniref:hypothetical protein n=1 Tax=Micromonospora sp. DT31 TaxID=3393434 RepID=UPI003CE8D002
MRANVRKSARVREMVQSTLLVAATVAAGVVVAASPAQAVTIQSCQDPQHAARLTYTDGTVSRFNCTGTYYPPNKKASFFWTGTWSGYITYDGRREKFCNGENNWLPLPVRINKLEFSPTKLC